MHSPLTPVSLRANFAWTFIGNLIFSGCQWAILVILARFGTPDIVGQFALGLAICTPILIFSNLQLRVIQATDVEDKYSFGDYFWLRLVTTGLFFLIIAGITSFGGYHWSTRYVILLIGVAKCFESLSDVLYGFSQKYERLDRIAISMMIRGPLGLGAMVTAFYLTNSLLLGTAAWGAAWAFSFFLVDIPNAFRLIKGLPIKPTHPWWPTSTKRVLHLAWVAAPMGWVVFVLSLSSNMPRYFLQSSLGESGVGLFSAVAALPGVLVLVINPLIHSVLPRLARLHSSKDHSFWSMIGNSLIIVSLGGFLFIVAVATVGKPVLHRLYGEAYANLSWLLILLGVAVSAQNLSTVLGAGLTAMGRFQIQGIIFTIHCGLTCLFCFWFIPRYSLLGAGIATIASAILQLFLVGMVLYLAWRAKRYEKKYCFSSICNPPI